MKANALVKHNIDAFLKARHQSRRDLAQWCRRSDAWISKIMNEERREFPMKYWDRIADFFGLATYQLLQPGLTLQTERRKGGDRRSGRDRRISAMNQHVRETVSQAVATLSPADVADVIRWRTLSEDSRAQIRAEMLALERSERQSAGPGRGRRRAGTDAGGAAGRGSRGRKDGTGV